MAKEPKIKVFRQSRACYGIDERAFLNPVTRWHCKNLSYPKQVDVSYKRLYWLQMPVVQTPLQINKKPCIVMRPVNSSEAMTANFAEIDFNLLEKLWLSLKEAGAGSLWYDVTHKPPGTIEWE